MKTGNFKVSTAIVLMLSINAFGATYHVPAEYETIQAAIDVASDDDVISIADGTYRGEGNRNIDFGGKSITVQSENGPETCIIDCELTARGFYFHQGEGRDAILKGLTITNGNGYYQTFPKDGVFVYGGGAIHCIAASPTIDDCIISDSKSMGVRYTTLGGYGGGIYVRDASPYIVRCRIVQNQATYGGGVYCWNSSPTLANCIISDNKGFDAYYHSPIIGGGGAVHCENSSPVLINCTLTQNRLEHYGEETGILHFEDSTPILTNCILWGNQDDALIFAGNSSPRVTYSDIQGDFEGEGNIDADPLFIDDINQDFHLMAGSPCIDAGTASGAPATDAEGYPRPVNAGYDMGAHEFQGVPSLPPVIESFSVSPATGKAPLDVTFTCVASDPENGPLTYSLDFGDGSAHEQNSSGRFTHTYTLAWGGATAVCTVSDETETRIVAMPVRVDFGPIMVPQHFSTIQDAIDEAADGDTILVADGAYPLGDGAIEFQGKALTVRSENGPANCTLTGGTPAVKFSFGDTEAALLEGFTIAESSGIGIHCTDKAAPVIRRCVITGHKRRGVGCWNYASPTFINCVIAHNSNPTHEPDGLGSDAVGVKVVDSSPRFINCTIADNQSYGISGQSSSPVTSIINSIIWGNEYPQLIYYADIRYSVTQNGVEGGGNIDADPLFVDAANGDYRLMPESPCIDAGTAEDAPDVDINNFPRPMGAGFDMGAYEVFAETPDPVHLDNGDGGPCFIGTIVH